MADGIGPKYLRERASYWRECADQHTDAETALNLGSIRAKGRWSLSFEAVQADAVIHRALRIVAGRHAA